jgi:hypothetical protein
MSVVRENTASRVSVIIKKAHFVSCVNDSPMSFFLVIRLLVTMERWASQYDSFSYLNHLKQRFKKSSLLWAAI